MSEPVPSTMSRKALEREIVQLRNMLAEERRVNAIRGEQLSNLTERHAALESKDDPTDTPRQSPVYEGPLWKSNASAELLAQIECGKYLYHLPFYRLARKMKAEGFDIADSTIDG